MGSDAEDDEIEDKETKHDVPVQDAPLDAEDAADDEGGETSRGFDRWRQESALGAVGTGIARGLQAVFAPPADEVVIMASVPGDPPDADDRVRVILDPDDPTKSIAIVRDPPDAPDPPDRRPGRDDPAG